MAGSARIIERIVAWHYLLALGSNRRHHRHGGPRQVLGAAIAALGSQVEACSPVIVSAPLGPSQRLYANAAVILRSERDPAALLDWLKAIEARFGRRRGGRRWGERVLDLDIVLWQGGCWTSPGLVIPHIAFCDRSFVLAPAAAIAPRWRDPVSGLTLRQLAGRLRRRLTKPRPLPIGHA